MDKITEVTNKVIEEFQKKPIVTTLKGVIILWVLKQLKKWWDSQ